MRCKNCGLENDDNLYICQNCGSPLYDEAEENAEDSTVEFKKIGGNENISEDNNANQNNQDNKNENNSDDDKKKKQLTITIIALSVVLIAVIAGVIGAVIASNKNNDDIQTTESTSVSAISTTKEETTVKTTQPPSTQAPIIQYMVTVRSNEGGSVDGGGQFEKGKQIKITAKPNNGYNFIGWYTATGKQVSQSLSYTFALTEDVVYEAKFEKIVETTVQTTKAPEKETQPTVDVNKNVTGDKQNG